MASRLVQEVIRVAAVARGNHSYSLCSAGFNTTDRRSGKRTRNFLEQLPPRRLQRVGLLPAQTAGH